MHRTVPTRSVRAFLLVAAVCVLLGLAASFVWASDATETHMVRHGDTLATIAAEHGITVKVLLALNPDVAAAEVVYVGQSLRVPQAMDLEAVPDVVCSAEYTVREGDTWVSIGKAHTVDAGTLAHVNRGDADVEPAAGMRLCLPVVAVPEASATPPAPRMECEDEIRYILQGEDPATFNYTDEALVPGSQVCVLAALGSGQRALLRVSTETGVTGWISSRHVGSWPAYLASTDPSLATPTATPRPTRTPRPTATPRPTHTPTPVAMPTPTAAPCREAWGASAVAYRVRRGPGTQHVHTGRYVSAGEPVCELQREQGWVQVRLADGATGWVHADGITNRQPASTPTPAPTATPGPASSAAPTPIPAVRTASGIVNRNHDFDYTIHLPAGWVKEWQDGTDTLWSTEDGHLRVRSYNQPAGTSLDQFAVTIRNNTRRDWWENASLFEVVSFERRQAGGQERYYLRYRVQESPRYCTLEVEEAIGVGVADAGPVRGFHAQYASCNRSSVDRASRDVLDSLRIVEVPSYYSQYLSVRGMWIKASGQVDPQALHAAADTVERMLARARPGIAACLAGYGADLAIIPRGSYVYELPEFAHLSDDPAMQEVSGLGGGLYNPTASTSEFNLLKLPGDPLPGSEVTVHEYAHSIQNICFTPAEQAHVTALLADARKAGLFPGTYAMSNVDEFFASFSEMFFNGAAWMDDYWVGEGIPRSGGRAALRRTLPGLYAFMERIYESG